jgi:small subunit ribosomal protein S14
MAKTCWIQKQKRKPKFKSRKYNRCSLSGRRRAFLRKFGISRIQFREMALRGEIPGVTLASW